MEETKTEKQIAVVDSTNTLPDVYNPRTVMSYDEWLARELVNGVRVFKAHQLNKDGSKVRVERN